MLVFIRNLMICAALTVAIYIFARMLGLYVPLLFQQIDVLIEISPHDGGQDVIYTCSHPACGNGKQEA